MINKTSSIDAEMVTKKYYCHKCGEKLVNNPRIRVIRRGDPDYKKYSRVGRTQFIGDIEHTEYDFKCCNCNRIISADEQFVISEVQKTLEKNILTEEEIIKYKNRARATIEDKRKLMSAIPMVVVVIMVIIIILTRCSF